MGQTGRCLAIRLSWNPGTFLPTFAFLTRSAWRVFKHKTLMDLLVPFMKSGLNSARRPCKMANQQNKPQGPALSCVWDSAGPPTRPALLPLPRCPGRDRAPLLSEGTEGSLGLCGWFWRPRGATWLFLNSSSLCTRLKMPCHEPWS